MAENDMLNSLKSLLGDNADEKINSVLGMLKSGADKANDISHTVESSIKTVAEKSNIPIGLANESTGKSRDNFFTPENLEYIARIKNIVNEIGSTNDQRSNLLMSLRPYMRGTRQKSIDNAVKLLNIARVTGLFNI